MILIERFKVVKGNTKSLVLCEHENHKGDRTRLLQRGRAIKKDTHICNSCATRERLKINHPMRGKHHSKETKEKMRLLKLGMYDGDKHYNWNPNLTDEERARKNVHRRNTPEDFAWIKAVLKRDNYQCQICGKRNNRLCVHHLNGHASFPEERFIVENGITLCKDHHKGFHSFCKGIITREEFQRWKESLDMSIH